MSADEKAHVPPELTPAHVAVLRAAARKYAEANRSDPFAYSRIMLYLRRGIVQPNEIT